MYFDHFCTYIPSANYQLTSTTGALAANTNLGGDVSRSECHDHTRLDDTSFNTTCAKKKRKENNIRTMAEK